MVFESEVNVTNFGIYNVQGSSHPRLYEPCRKKKKKPVFGILRPVE